MKSFKLSGRENIGLPLNLHIHESVSNTQVIKYFRLLFQLISCSINSACSTPSWEDLCCEKGSCSWHRQTKEGVSLATRIRWKAFWISSLLWFLFSVPVSIQLPQRLSLKYSRICAFFQKGARQIEDESIKCALSFSSFLIFSVGFRSRWPRNWQLFTYCNFPTKSRSKNIYPGKFKLKKTDCFPLVLSFIQWPQDIQNAVF